MNGLQAAAFFGLSILLESCGAPEQPKDESHPSWGGTDFSQLPKIELEGFDFRNEDSIVVDPIQYLADQGLEVVRLKVWNNPSGDGSLAELVPISNRIHAAGMDIMLTLHYSNTWADPGSQHIPQQWEGLSLEHLEDSVRTFTYSIVNAIQPDFVQIGNEINHGLMHPVGVRDGSGTFQRILTWGLDAAKSANDSVQTFIHYAGYQDADPFFQTIDSLDFDAIGLSYYPKWHGKNLNDFKTACFALQNDFSRPVYIVETSYPFTLGWADWTNNHIGSLDQIMGAFPPTRAGQAAYISELRNITDSLGTGLMYWGGELVPWKGPQAQDGSVYENQALFSFQGVALPVINELGH